MPISSKVVSTLPANAVSKEQSTKKAKLSAAKDLIRRGFDLVILARGTKVPATSRGVKNPVRDIKDLLKLTKTLESFDFAIVTGGKLGLVVIDIDPRNGGDRSWRTLKGEQLLKTAHLPKVRTGSGTHYYMRLNNLDFNKFSLAPGIDVLGNNSYAVAPGSVHANGVMYQWVKNIPVLAKDIPFARGRLKELIDNRSSKNKPLNNAKSDSTNDPIGGSFREQHLMSIAGKLHRKKKTRAQIMRRLSRINTEHCLPPLSDAEVAQIVETVLQYDNGAAAGDPMERLAAAYLQGRYRGGRHLRFESDGQFWAYNGQVWSPIREAVLERQILEFMATRPDAPKSKRVQQVREIMQFLRTSLAAMDDLLHFKGDPPPVLNLKNGELWLKPDGSVELKEHSWQSGLRSQLQVAYDPIATCDEYDRALEAIFSKATEPEAMIDLWDEVVGYVIQPRRHIPLILILFGTGGNGKTKLVETIRKLLGEDAVYSGSVHDLGKNRFAYATLFGKQLFVDDDVEQGVRLPDGTLKKISEEKDLTADVKHKAAFNFRSRVVPMLLCNNVPTLSDVSPGMRRRLMVIEFKRRFTGKREDKDLFPRIWENELPGILNRALNGLARLQERGRFNQPKDAKEGLSAFLGQANPLTAFVEDRCETTEPTAQELLQNLYQAYAEWAKEGGITRTLQKLTMKRHLANLGYGSKKTNKGQAIVGLQLRA